VRVSNGSIEVRREGETSTWTPVPPDAGASISTATHRLALDPCEPGPARPVTARVETTTEKRTSESGDRYDVRLLKVRLVELDVSVVLYEQPAVPGFGMAGKLESRKEGFDVRLGSMDTHFIWHFRPEGRLLRIRSHVNDVDGMGWERVAYMTLPCRASVTVVPSAFTTGSVPARGAK